MDVPSDFLMYGSGVYQRTNLASRDHSGFHSVKVIGWGEEAGTPYWLCMNSWGRDWGEDGLFKIVRGRNEVQGRGKETQIPLLKIRTLKYVPGKRGPTRFYSGILNHFMFEGS